MEKKALPRRRNPKGCRPQPDTEMILATLSVAIAAMQPVPETWLDAVAQTESNNRSVSGDKGLAAGVFQFHASAWADCSKVRKAAGLKTHPYSKAYDPAVAREYARTWLSYLTAKLGDAIGRPPHLGEVWLAYNMGLTGFRKYSYQWSFVPEAKYATAVKLLTSLTAKRK